MHRGVDKAGERPYSSADWEGGWGSVLGMGGGIFFLFTGGAVTVTRRHATGSGFGQPRTLPPFGGIT